LPSAWISPIASTNKKGPMSLGHQALEGSRNCGRVSQAQSECGHIPREQAASSPGMPLGARGTRQRGITRTDAFLDRTRS
jgi:hypothetical protein